MAKAKAETNTTDSIQKKSPISQAEMDAAVKKAATVFKNAKKVKVTIPKYLKGRLGPVHYVGINGAGIWIEVGVESEIPEPYKAVLEESLNNLSL